MKNLDIRKIMKEMEKYGWTEEKIKIWYNDTEKEVSFEEYVKCFYMSDYYINEKEAV